MRPQKITFGEMSSRRAEIQQSSIEGKPWRFADAPPNLSRRSDSRFRLNRSGSDASAS